MSFKKIEKSCGSWYDISALGEIILVPARLEVYPQQFLGF